ncbi:MAG: Do family serine endopeptidase [Waddliaceae bacterium]|jgi:serine protease Do|nr:Do family serine endopeptidase [Waddliaceae bacterium]MBT3578424.1 Do family serine endopeptidase [Waddliaceae bacterium]MBT7264625.1 Do family serine endopeptidase [Waddliaceae bacterium]
MFLSRAIKKIVLLPLFVMMAIMISPLHAISMTSDLPINNIFSEVANKTTPAVVYITAELITSPYNQQQQQPASPPLDLFEQFFGPRNPGVQQQQQQQQQQKQYSQGSGFLVSVDGYILTNNHVIANTQNIVVTLVDGNEYDAEVIGTDPSTDLAVIKISDEDKEFPFLTLGNSDILSIGEWVLAIGNPLGFQTSVSAGIVSAKNRGNLNLSSYEDFIQTDAAINMGNSGGPLVNLDGKVVGINAGLASNNGGYIGIGFAIPSTMAKTVMMQLIETGTVSHGFLGASLQNVTNDLAEAFDLEAVKGAIIADIVKDGAADKSGVERGDIVLEYDDIIVENMNTFRNAIGLMEPGTETLLTIKREGKIIEVPVIIGAHPDNIASEAISASVTQKIGLIVEPLDDDAAQKLGYIDEEGTVVTSVRPQSPADIAGIRPGALIISVNHKKVNDPEEFEKALSDNDSDKALILVKQGPMTLYITLKTK